jgi:hypothetical protein
MKSLRFLLALAFASSLALSVVRAHDHGEKSKDKSAEKEACTKMACCAPKDGKAGCATEGKSCCCDTGEKAKDAKKEDAKKEEPKK